MTKEKIENFINFKFVPLSRHTYITRILIFWIFNIPFYFFDKFSVFVGIIFSIINLFNSVLFITLAINKPETKEAKFLSDGIAYLYYSAVCLFAGFIILSLPNGYNYLLLLVLILVYLLFFVLFFLTVLKNIKKDIYNEKNIGSGGNIFIAPFTGGLLGIAIGRFFSSGNSNEQLSFYILSACFLFLAYICTIGSAFLVKWYFLRNLSKYQD